MSTILFDMSCKSLRIEVKNSYLILILHLTWKDTKEVDFKIAPKLIPCKCPVLFVTRANPYEVKRK